MVEQKIKFNSRISNTNMQIQNYRKLESIMRLFEQTSNKLDIIQKSIE